MRAQRIRDILLQKYSEPQIFELQDESHLHAGRAGQESHFKLLLVSASFAGLNRVQRQRAINDFLSDEYAQGLHALSMRLMTPEEWEKSPKNFKTPDCQGGR